MIGRGYLFALRPEEVGMAISCTSASNLHLLLATLGPAGQVAELDKAWLAIDRCLALGFPPGPLAWAVLGGRVVAEGAGLVATLVPPEDVVAVAQAVERIEEETFRDGFAAIAGPEPDGESEELDVLYAWGWFQRLRALYRRAADARQAVLFAGELAQETRASVARA